MTTTEAPEREPEQDQATTAPGDRPTQAQDVFFERLTTGAGILILVVLLGVAFFLTQKSLPALSLPPEALPNAENIFAYTLPLLFGTVWAAILALVLATPLAVGIALYMTHYAPKPIAKVIGFMVDLLAAVPSVVFGLWGIIAVAPFFVPIYQFQNDYLGWIPIFGGDVSPSGRNMATAAGVIAIMILPIIASIAKEVFSQTPRLLEEASLALGATRWEMIRTAVLPHGKSGVIGGAMLGLGRALGETMAVALILSPVPGLMSFEIFTTENPSTIAANIALSFANFGGDQRSALYFTGLVLFITTFIVNYVARRIADGASPAEA